MHRDVIATMPIDCRPAPGTTGAHCYTLGLEGANSKITIRVRDRIFYIVKADQAKLDAARSADGPVIKTDAKGGATVSWKKYTSIEAAWAFVKSSVMP